MGAAGVPMPKKGRGPPLGAGPAPDAAGALATFTSAPSSSAPAKPPNAKRGMSEAAMTPTNKMLSRDTSEGEEGN